MNLAHVEHCDADFGGPTLDCPGCRCEHAMVRALDRELAPQPDDDDRLARAIAVAMLPGAPPPVDASPVAAATSTGIGWTWITAGVVAAVAAAAVVVGRPSDRTSEEAEVARREPATVEASGIVVEAGERPAVEVVAIEPIVIEPVAIEPVALPTIVAPEVAEPGEPRPRAKPVRPAPPTETAAELFARATKARRSGKRSEAIALYRELQVSFAESREASVGTVALGRSLLDENQDKGALTAFDRYLTRAPTGTLAEEALVGKATALARLGRARDEAAVWRALIERFPDSATRGRAQARLAAIDP